MRVASAFALVVAVFVAAAQSASTMWTGSLYTSTLVAGRTNVTFTASMRPGSGSTSTTIVSGDYLVMRLTGAWATENAAATCKMSKRTRSYDLDASYYTSGTSSYNAEGPEEGERVIGVRLSNKYTASGSEYTNLICLVTMPASAVGKVSPVVSSGYSSPFDDVYIGAVSATTVSEEPAT